MRAVLQRVTRARVSVGGEVVGSIGPGLCLLIGVTHDDSTSRAARLAEKAWGLRVFDDDAGVMNRALADQAHPQALCISQFTLYGDTSRGRRPSWLAAAPSAIAKPLFSHLVSHLRELGATVATGRFGADMAVELVNDGPVTLVLET